MPLKTDMESHEQAVQSDNVNDIPSSLLISATYNSQQKKAVLKFYEPKSGKIFLWNDKTGHKPYCCLLYTSDAADE